MTTLIDKIKKLPNSPGVYFFRGERGEILYIGKATNLRSRVGSYFRGVILSETKNPDKSTVSDIEVGILHSVQDDTKGFVSVAGRSGWISLMVSQVEDIDYQETDSVLEALILESNLIKKHQPKYNTLEKDDKSFSYFVITKEEFPRVLIVRKTDLDKPIRNYESNTNLRNKKIQNKKSPSKLFVNLPAGKAGCKLKIENSAVYGPYTSKQQMQIALKIIRRIFPFHALKQKTEKGCLDFQLGRCPGPYANAISIKDYKKNIHGIEMILQGKKKRLISTLEKEMIAFAKKNEFEKAGEIRNKIFALQHIRDVALMTRDFEESDKRQVTSDKNHHVSGIMSHVTRIEAYDISNISGTDAVGSMVVFENGAPNKSQYRKFKIKTVEGSNDVAMMREVLLRRFKNDWRMPDLILLDGGLGHANAIGGLVWELGLDVLILAVAKGKTRKNLNFHSPAGESSLKEFSAQLQEFLDDKNLVKSIMNEAHRFAITFHRKIRNKNALK